MKILVTGRGTSGSWAIRGVQLGRAIAADVVPNASKVNGCDLAVIVKRPRADMLYRLTGVPIIWDIVDSWPQPVGNEWNREQCMAWLRGQVATIKPAGIVAATRAMAKDCAEFGIPVLALPHHARPGQAINPIRERVQTIGYEGGDYLGYWRAILEAECKARDAVFAVNPRSLSDLDIVVAVRSTQGYAAKNWKSNCKVANAQGSGTPCVMNREAGYLETARGGVAWADSLDELRYALDSLVDAQMRRAIAVVLLASQPKLDEVAVAYKAWLASKF